LKVFPDDPELHFRCAHILSTLERFPEARDHYLRVPGADISGHYSSVDMGILGYKAYFNLGQVCLQMNDYPQTRDAWLRALESAPDMLTIAFDLFNTAAERSDWATAERMLETVRSREGCSENWGQMAARFAELRGCSPKDILFQAIQIDPKAAGPRLVLARHMLEKGEEAAAREHLEVLSGMGVAEGAYCLGVWFVKRGDLSSALAAMERANSLNPSHQETVDQIAAIRRAMGGSDWQK